MFLNAEADFVNLVPNMVTNFHHLSVDVVVNFDNRSMHMFVELMHLSVDVGQEVERQIQFLLFFRGIQDVSVQECIGLKFRLARFSNCKSQGTNFSCSFAIVSFLNTITYSPDQFLKILWKEMRNETLCKSLIYVGKNMLVFCELGDTFM